MKKTIMFGILISIILISGAGCEIDEKLAKEIVSENIEKLVVCESPYIRYGTECCLDQNNNKICDNDEGTTTQPTPETPTQNTTQPIAITCGNVGIGISEEGNRIKISNKAELSINKIFLKKYKNDNVETEKLKFTEKLGAGESSYYGSYNSYDKIEFIPVIINNENKEIECTDKIVTWKNPTSTPPATESKKILYKSDLPKDCTSQGGLFLSKKYPKKSSLVFRSTYYRLNIEGKEEIGIEFLTIDSNKEEVTLKFVPTKNGIILKLDEPQNIDIDLDGVNDVILRISDIDYNAVGFGCPEDTGNFVLEFEMIYEKEPISTSYSLECTSNCDRGIQIISQEYQTGDFRLNENDITPSHQFLVTLKNENPRNCGMFCSVWEGINYQPTGEDREDMIIFSSVGSYKVTTLRTNNPTSFQLVCSDESASERGCDSRIKQMFKVK